MFVSYEFALCPSRIGFAFDFKPEKLGPPIWVEFGPAKRFRAEYAIMYFKVFVFTIANVFLFLPLSSARLLLLFWLFAFAPNCCKYKIAAIFNGLARLESTTRLDTAAAWLPNSLTAWLPDCQSRFVTWTATLVVSASVCIRLRETNNRPVGGSGPSYYELQQIAAQREHGGGLNWC